MAVTEIITVKTKNWRQVIEDKRKEGWEVYNPSWPDLLLVSPPPERHPRFVFIKGAHGRISPQKAATAALLQELGWEVEEVIVKGERRRRPPQAPTTQSSRSGQAVKSRDYKDILTLLNTPAKE